MRAVDSKKIVIADLDGTIAIDDGRAEKYLWGRDAVTRDWDGYYSEVETDVPNMAVVELLRVLRSQNILIYIMSGRRGDTRSDTLRWLEQHWVPYDVMMMRPIGDRTQDTELKWHWVESLGIHDDILFVIEDRKRMVDMWRAKGLNCFQVRPGDF